MNKLLKFLFYLVILLSLSATAQGEASNLNQSYVGVDQLMNHVGQYTGKITVEGVVSRVFPDHHLLGLIDVRELKECGVTTCASLTLPVKWKGTLPEIKSTILVTGKVLKENGRLVFIAKSLSIKH